MGNKEIILLHELNSKMVKLVNDFGDVVKDFTKLTQMVYQKEIDGLDNEYDIKLRSHM